MANHAKRLIISRLTEATSFRCCYSTLTTTTTLKNNTTEDSLLHKLSFLGKDASVADTLDDWVNQGKSVKRFDLVKNLRNSKKYHHALQVYDWMERGNSKTMNDADQAVRIDLLAKTEGVASAEKYFNSLEGSAKTTKTYGALLSCYSREKMLDKAVQLFEKMKELNFTSALNYNNMMFLYLKIGQPEKVPLLVEEMEEKSIAADKYIYNKLMNSYAARGDFDAVEGVLERMRSKKVIPDWFTYGNLATIYVNEGFIDKANAALQEMESMKKVRDREAFHTLINLYARTSNLLGVYRAWESLKLVFAKPTNISYLMMLLGLFKLGDVDGLEKYYREWESGYSTYDARIPNVLLESYLDRNMVEEANALFESMVSRGTELHLRTLNLFTDFYLKKCNMDMALKYIEMGVSKVGSEKTWFPNDDTVSMFMKLLKEETDLANAEKFYKSMKKIGRLDPNASALNLFTAEEVEPPVASTN